jgi:hypothetical protein
MNKTLKEKHSLLLRKIETSVCELHKTINKIIIKILLIIKVLYQKKCLLHIYRIMYNLYQLQWSLMFIQLHIKQDVFVKHKCPREGQIPGTSMIEVTGRSNINVTRAKILVQMKRSCHKVKIFGTNGKVLLQGILMWNVNALVLANQKIYPSIKFWISRSNIKVKVTR